MTSSTGSPALSTWLRPEPVAAPEPVEGCCGERMIVYEPGQTTHPNCDPTHDQASHRFRRFSRRKITRQRILSPSSDLSPGPSCVPTMFDLNADGSCDDRCEACGSGPYHCWMYLQMMRVGCCERCSHWHDAVLAREVFYDWEEFSEDRCKCRKCEAWRKRRDSCPCENCRD